MLFNTLHYAYFFAAVFGVSWILHRLGVLRMAFLLGASYFFYAQWNPYYLPLIFASSTVDYWLARKIDAASCDRARKRWLVGTVVVNLGFLGFFKYWNFGVDTVLAAAHAAHLNVPAPYVHLALPIGISFFTFESMSYVIDVYKRTTKPCDSYLKYLLFVAFFPHLVAGPIVRPRDLIPQFDNLPKWDDDEGSRALFLIATGLAKKIVISDYLSLNLVDRVFAQPSSFSALEVLCGIYGYAVQIYCDFSGYTDIAIGSAALLGVKFPTNFNAPYTATNIQEFWNRWHMSLSTWLRDYLFTPLGGGVGSTGRTVRNFLITMVLGGLWHGAAWNFVFWGLLHGAALAATFVYWTWLESRGIRRRKRKVPLWRQALGVLATFHFVCLGWVFFRADSFTKSWAILKRLASLTYFHPNLQFWVVVALLVGLVSHFVPDKLFASFRDRFVRLPAVAQGGVMFAIALLLHRAASAEAVPFVYFQF